MKKMKSLYALLLILSLGISSCTISAHYITTDKPLPEETLAADVKIYAGDIDREYEVIGSMTLDAQGDASVASRYLKKRAARLGADAVIFVEVNKLNSYTIRTGISGVVIKFINE
tara:strand:+ start:594 stop:938 length:345 start_codon:yes stop_codon:yes gene_type:complete